MSYIVFIFWEEYQVITSKRSYYRFPRYLVKNIVIAFMKSFWKDRDIYCLSCIAWKYCNVILKLSCRALRCIWLRLFILMKHIDSREGSVFEEALQMKPIKSGKSEGNILNTPSLPPQGRCIRHWYGESMFVIYKAGDAVVIMVIRTGGGRAGAKQRNQRQQRAADRSEQHEWFRVWECELVTLQAQLHSLIWGVSSSAVGFSLGTSVQTYLVSYQLIYTHTALSIIS